MPVESTATSSTYWRSPVIWLALLVGLLFIVAGVQAMVTPARMSLAFGLPMVSATETAFVQVYGSRTVVIAAFVVAQLVLRRVQVAALLLSIATVLPLVDVWVIAQRRGFGPATYQHFGYLALLAVLSLMLWRQSRAMRREGALAQA